MKINNNNEIAAAVVTTEGAKALRPAPCALINGNHLFTKRQGVLTKIRR